MLKVPSYVQSCPYCALLSLTPSSGRPLWMLRVTNKTETRNLFGACLLPSLPSPSFLSSPLSSLAFPFFFPRLEVTPQNQLSHLGESCSPQKIKIKLTFTTMENFPSGEEQHL